VASAGETHIHADRKNELLYRHGPLTARRFVFPRGRYLFRSVDEWHSTLPTTQSGKYYLTAENFFIYFFVRHKLHLNYRKRKTRQKDVTK